MKNTRFFVVAASVAVAAGLIIGLGALGKAGAAPAPSGQTTLIAGRNVNMISGTKLPFGDPWLQRQNEPSLAASTRNPLHLLAGANDYRTIDVPDDFKLPNIEGTNAADAWLGLYESFDGGESWVTTLLPGFPQDLSAEGISSPLKAYETACDPIVRAGANGLFYYCGIAFNRSAKTSAIFVARFQDNNNLEKVEIRTDEVGAKKYYGPIRYVDTRLVATGSTSTSFIDMPNMAVDIPRRGALYGTIYVAYTVFSNTSGGSVADKIFLQKSTDGGVTWSMPPVQLSLAGEVVQRPVIAVDPLDAKGDTLYVAFRRFAKGTTPDGIVVVKSTNGGRTFTRLPDPAPSFSPFDQGTNADPSAFRTNSYPTMAVGDLGTVYIAWSQRIGGPSGQARIVHSALKRGSLSWTTPQLADPTYAGQGHQFMPSLTFAAWKLMLVWYDQRGDQALDGAAFIRDTAGGERHTIDVRAAEGRPGLPPFFQPSIQLSRYLYVLELGPDGRPIQEGGVYRAVQAEASFINYPLFQLGTVPFHGDYLEITPSMRLLPPAIALGSWIYNINPFEAASFHAAWTDNRDVRPPAGNMWGNWANYSPPVSAQDPNWPEPAQPCIGESTTGMRNQNVYSAHLNKGLIMGSPGNTKQLDLPLTGEGGRTFVVFVKNTTALERNLNLVLLQIGGVNASFDQFRDDDSIKVTLPPYSSSSCTVYVDSSTRALAPVTVNALEGLKLVGYVILNPDPTNLPVTDPDNPFRDLGKETHDPDVSAPQVWNYDLDGSSDPDPSAMLNPRVQNPRVQNDSVVNPRVQNEGVLNPRVQNESIINNEVPNPRVQNTAVPNGALTDVTWTVTNEGNTTSVFTADIQSQNPAYFEGPNPPLIAQVLVYKVHRVPVDSDCRLYETHQDELVANVTNPRVQNPRVQNSPPAETATTQAADLTGQDVTFFLAPGEQAEVTFRVWDADTTDGSPTFSPAQVIVEVTADAVNTENVETGNLVPSYDVPPNSTPWTTSPSLVGALPASITVRVPAGANPVNRTIEVWNAGGGVLDYSVSVDAAWLNVSPTTGSSAGPNYRNTHLITLSTAGLSVGSYIGTVTVTDPLAANNPFRIPVTVDVLTSGLPPANEWTARYTSGQGESEDMPSKVVVDDAGYVYVAGSSGPAGLKDAKVVKYNPDGTMAWEMTHTGVTGPMAGNDLATDMVIDVEGSVYVAGSTQGSGDYDFLVYKYAANGELQWTAVYGNGPGMQDQGRAIALDAAGNIFVAGWSEGPQSENDFAVVKFGPGGQTLWSRRYAGTGGLDDILRDLVLDQAGNVIITGTSYENGTGNDITTVKFANDGTWLWTRSYAQPVADDACALAVGPAGRIYVTGRTFTGPGSAAFDIVTFAYSPAGDLVPEWGGTFDGPGEGLDSPMAMAADAQGNVYVTGEVDSGTLAVPNADYITLKYNADGTLAWSARYNGPGNGIDTALGLAFDPLSDSVVVTGYSNSGTEAAPRHDFATVKYSSAGSPDWVRRYDGPASGTDSGQSVAVDRVGNVYVTGWSTGTGTGYDIATIKYMPDLEDWSATENGSAGLMDNSYAVKTDAQGNVYVTGESAETGNGLDTATIKYSPSGARLWRSLYNGSAGGDDSGQDLVVDSAGNVYVAGTSVGTGAGAEIATWKYLPNGSLAWARFYGTAGTVTDQGVAIGLLPGGNVVVTGTLGSQNVATICYDGNGEELWARTYSDPDIQYSSASDLAVSGAGNVYVAGTCFGTGTGSDFLLLKYDGNGNFLWARRYDDPSHRSDRANALAVDSNEGAYMTGSYSIPLGAGWLYVSVTVKFDAAGLLSWQSFSTESTGSYGIALDASGNVYLAGGATIKLNASGVQQWAKIGRAGRGRCLALDAAGNLYVAGFIDANISNSTDCSTTKYDPSGNELWTAAHHHPGDDMGMAIAIDASDRVYVVTVGYSQETTGDMITISYGPGRN